MGQEEVSPGEEDAWEDESACDQGASGGGQGRQMDQPEGSALGRISLVHPTNAGGGTRVLTNIQASDTSHRKVQDLGCEPDVPDGLVHRPCFGSWEGQIFHGEDRKTG